MHSRSRLFAVVLGAAIAVLGGCADLTRPGTDEPTKLEPPDAFRDVSSDVIVVDGQQDPAVDVAAVQQAVDEGGTVVLRGTFSFQGTLSQGDSPRLAHVVHVTGPVTIRGEEATILGGGSAAAGGFQAVFLVEAPGA
ncbi:MAG: hypothetical protein R3266_15365, partial [Gemmatimonadota bacterium]|nr:hypothetical protein [Gemmatimonadota bacterium]